MTDFKLRQVASIKAKLKNISLERDILFEDLLTSFLIERAMRRLVSDPTLARALVFKGGFVSITVYASPRYTVDLDAVVRGRAYDQVQALAMEALKHDFQDGVWFEFETTSLLKTQSEYGGLRLHFRTGLFPPPKELRRSKILHIDLGMGDPITPNPKKCVTRSLLGHEDISWDVYPLETICAEKIHAMIQLGSENSRSKDVFDLAFLLPKSRGSVLVTALEQTFQYRKTILPAQMSNALQTLDTAILRRGWNAAVGDIKPAPVFENSWNSMIAELKRFGI